MERLLRRLKQIQDDVLKKNVPPGHEPRPHEYNDTLMIAMATVLHESGIRAKPTAAEKVRFIEMFAPKTNRNPRGRA